MPTKLTNEESRYRIKVTTDMYGNERHMPQYLVKFLFLSWWIVLSIDLELTLDAAEKFIRKHKRENSNNKITYKYY